MGHHSYKNLISYLRNPSCFKWCNQDYPFLVENWLTVYATAHSIALGVTKAFKMVTTYALKNSKCYVVTSTLFAVTKPHEDTINFT